jgi:O-antigen/teichoic acid export membrane protein
MVLGLIGTVNAMTDRLFLKNLLPTNFYPNRLSADALGIYGQCYKLSMLMQLAVQSFKFSADPFLFSNSSHKKPPNLLALVMKWFVIVCVILWLLVSLNNDLIGYLFLRTKIYREGLYVVPILSLANLFLGIYYNLAFWFKLTDKTNYGILTSGVGVVLTVVLNIILIPRMGYMGCAWAFLVSSVAMCVVCYLLGERHYAVPYNLRSALGYILSAALLIYLSSYIKINNLGVSVVYHSALCLLYLTGIMIVERKAIPLKIRQKIKILN